MEVSVHQLEIHIVVYVLHNTQAIPVELSCQQALEMYANQIHVKTAVSVYNQVLIIIAFVHRPILEPSVLN